MRSGSPASRPTAWCYLKKSPLRLLIHLHRKHHAGGVRLARQQELDVVIGRIVGHELRGIRVDRMRVVVETDGRFTEYSLDFNAADLPSRRPSGEPWKPPVVAVESRDIVGGSLPVFVDLASARPVDAWLLKVLQRRSR